MKYDRNDKKKRQKAEVSKIDPVPRYRSYGVTKKETWLTRFNNHFADLLIFISLSLSLVIVALGLYAVIYMLGATGILISVLTVAAMIYFLALRTYRKRLKFLRKLKKQCKKYKYRLKFKRSFFKGLKYNEKGLDFTVETGKKLWCVRFLAVRQYESSMIFHSNNAIDIVSPPREQSLGATTISTNIITGTRRRTRLSLFSLFVPKKKKTLDFVFAEIEPTINNKTAKRALIVNPVPRSMFKKLHDGTVTPIGTGEYINGYTVFSGSGFLETLLREDV